MAALDPTLPVDIATLRERVSKLADQPRFQTTLVGFFAARTGAGGDWALWGDLVSGGAADAGDWRADGFGCGERRYSAAGDGEESAIDFVGVVVGLVAALAVSRVLSSLLFGVGPRDPVTYVW